MLEHQIELLNYVTEWNLDATEMLKIAERIFTLQRVINVRYGVSRKNDTLPPKIFKPLEEGVSAGKVPIHFENLLGEYYKIRGWDINGKPTVERLMELNLALKV